MIFSHHVKDYSLSNLSTRCLSSRKKTSQLRNFNKETLESLSLQTTDQGKLEEIKGQNLKLTRNLLMSLPEMQARDKKQWEHGKSNLQLTIRKLW